MHSSSLTRLCVYFMLYISSVLVCCSHLSCHRLKLIKFVLMNRLSYCCWYQLTQWPRCIRCIRKLFVSVSMWLVTYCLHHYPFKKSAPRACSGQSVGMDTKLARLAMHYFLSNSCQVEMVHLPRHARLVVRKAMKLSTSSTAHWYMLCEYGPIVCGIAWPRRTIIGYIPAV